jgi:hypothetical protein
MWHGVSAAYLLLLAALAAVPIAATLRFFATALPFRWGLDYNEGIVWKQMIEIFAGRGYGPVDGFPAIVFHYPPVYHVALGLVAGLGVDPLFAGRAISLAATFGSVAIVADLSRRLTQTGSRPITWLAAAAGGWFYLCFEAVHIWAPQLRVDALACFLTLAGMWLTVAALRRPALIYLAAIMFVLGVYTKHTSVVAPAASFGVLLLARPGLAIRGAGLAVLLGMALLARLMIDTDGGFLRHLIAYNINRFDLSKIIQNLSTGTTMQDRIFIAIGVLGAVLAARRVWRNRAAWRADAQLIDLILLAFVVLGTLSLIATAKYGSSSNYYIQWQAGLAAFAGWLVALCLGRAVKGADSARDPILISGAMIVLALAIANVQHPRDHLAGIGGTAARNVRLAALLRQVEGPIISDDMVLLLRTGRDVVYEPAIFAELSATGQWDEQIFTRQLKTGAIGAVVAQQRFIGERYTPGMLRVLYAEMPESIAVGRWMILLPRAAKRGLDQPE